MASEKIKVALCWHMHQPEYVDQINGEFIQPWVYLHCIKDYIDMAQVLEEYPLARVVVNFSPVLLEQIEESVRRINAYFIEQRELPDLLLRTLVKHQINYSDEEKCSLIKLCLRANEERLIHRFEPFHLLTETGKRALNDARLLNYLPDQFFFDLLCWYFIAWMGETVRNHNKFIKQLSQQQGNFNYPQRVSLLELIGDIIKSIIPKYRQLLEKEQIEISISPGSHPIIPLILDFSAARDTEAEISLPACRYPEGEARAIKQIQHSIETYQRLFGQLPAGCWPSEGSICNATLHLLKDAGFQWVASGGTVLKNSLHKGQQKYQCIHHAFTLQENDLHCFFRDDPLSDLIGFTYSRWHAADAVSNMIHQIINIDNACNNNPSTIIPIILDGENCWEYYPNNGYFFLKELYARLSSHPQIELLTFSDFINQKYETQRLNTICAGSWVYGTFSTWIGSPDKNRAWELLCEAKLQADRILADPNLSKSRRTQIENQLGICEASDWFWWFGDYNSAESVKDFDQLYRRHLHNLYRMLGLDTPDTINTVISVGKGNPENSGTMKRSH
jgi:alpha-amylase/alpha-mannosidase (GH57 family)